jgi:hypothetical protein
LTPEVTNALVRLMTGEIDIQSLPKEDLYSLASALVPDRPRSLLHQALAALNDRGETFAQIAERLGVHEATAARWAKPPAEDRRRRRAVDAPGLPS